MTAFYNLLAQWILAGCPPVSLDLDQYPRHKARAVAYMRRHDHARAARAPAPFAGQGARVARLVKRAPRDWATESRRSHLTMSIASLASLLAGETLSREPACP